MSTLQVNEITDTGGSTLLGRRNAIINGNFDVWQRGTSQTAAGYGSADRWRTDIATSTQSVTRQTFTLGQTDVPYNPKHYYSNVVTTGSTASSYSVLRQRIEDVATFAGETVTLSFYAKADASKNIAVEFRQYFGTTGSPSATVNISPETVALTTSWAKYTVTVDVPSISGKTLGTDGNDFISVGFWLDAGSDYNARTNSLGNQSGTFEFAQVQLEAGSVATPFERRSYGEELALCQRYYQSYRSTDTSDIVLNAGQTGNGTYTTSLTLVQSLRGTPTVTTYGSITFRGDGADTGLTFSNVNWYGETALILRLNFTGANIGNGFSGALWFQSGPTNGVVFDSEL